MHLPPQNQPHTPSLQQPEMAAQEYYRMSAQQNQAQQPSPRPVFSPAPPSYTSYDPNPPARPAQQYANNRPPAMSQPTPPVTPHGRPPMTGPLPTPQSHYNQRPPIQQTHSSPPAQQQQQSPYASRPVPIQHQQPYYPSGKGPAPQQPYLSPPPEKWQYPQTDPRGPQPYYPPPAAVGLGGLAAGAGAAAAYQNQRPYSHPYTPGPHYPHHNGYISDHSRDSYSDSDGRHNNRRHHRRRKHRHSDAAVGQEKSPRKDKTRDRFFGASTGALLGDIFIAPGVGTAMGAILGGLGGDSYNKNKHKEKQKERERELERDRDHDYRSRSWNR